MLLDLLMSLNLFMLTHCLHRNNVCKSLKDYKTIQSNPRCYYNFAADKTTPEIVSMSGYPVEIHEVKTTDGYTLVLHRIPNREERQSSPVFLQHGIITASNFFVSKGNESLAFNLARAGYDVWMGNFRGNIYSYKHDKLTMENAAYWNYTLDDISLKDLPEVLKYVVKVTKFHNGLFYIGHSLGSTLPLLFASEYPQEAKKLLKVIILMAPAYSLRSTSPFIYNAATITRKIFVIMERFNLIPLISNGYFERKVVKSICQHEIMKMCYRIFNMIVSTKNTVTPELFPVVLNMFPQGGSVNLALQIADTLSKPLSKFDYGKSKNMKLYGKNEPPEYKLKNIKVPVHVIAAESDNITSVKDSLKLYADLSPPARSGFFMVPTKYFTHVDYALGKYMDTMLNSHILEYLNNIKK